MKKYLIIIVALFISEFAFSQTQANSFECIIKSGYQSFTKNEVISFMTHTSLENFRLQDQRITLSFDNDFDIILLSAKELLQLGIITDISSYQTNFPPQYTLPKFHLTQTGQICTEYPIHNNVKYSRGRK